MEGVGAGVDQRFEFLLVHVAGEARLQDRAGMDVKPKRSGRTKIDNAQVGALELGYEKLPIPDADRMTLVLYHAEPGTRSAQGLALLASAGAEEHSLTGTARRA
jgi:MmyB-like transcription regulator ligand binding domain